MTAERGPYCRPVRKPTGRREGSYSYVLLRFDPINVRTCCAEPHIVKGIGMRKVPLGDLSKRIVRSLLMDTAAGRNYTALTIHKAQEVNAVRKIVHVDLSAVVVRRLVNRTYQLTDEVIDGDGLNACLAVEYNVYRL